MIYYKGAIILTAPDLGQPKDSKIFQEILKDFKKFQELISNKYFALKEPARAQKANFSSSSSLP